MTQILSGTNRDLARRIERAHAQSGLAAAPDSVHELVAGGTAIFQPALAGATQALAAGMDGPVTSEELDRLEDFFHSRGSAAVIDLCTLADPSLVFLIQQRGYTVREISNVLARQIDPGMNFPVPPAEIDISEVQPEQMQDWARIVARGFMEAEEPPEEQVRTMSRHTPSVHAYLASMRGEPSAGAAFVEWERLGTFVGDATLLRARGRGLQRAMIYHRLKAAAALGCDVASASVLPGSASHRNYERAGFQLLYARVMVALPPHGSRT